jgi:hypothetical protein
MTALYLFVAAVVASVGWAAWALGRDSRRRERIMAFAVRRGWSYTMRDPLLVDRWIGFPFGRGEKREATAVLSGEVGGRRFTAFEYTYVLNRESPSSTRSGVSHVQQKRRFSIVVVDMPNFLPKVVVMPGRRFDRLAAAAGAAQDIELESEDFNRAFRVSAPNPKSASDLLTPRTMAMLLSRPRFAFRVEGAHLVSWQPGTLDPMDVLRRASTLDAVIDGVPAYLWADHGERLPSGSSGSSGGDLPLPPGDPGATPPPPA